MVYLDDYLDDIVSTGYSVTKKAQALTDAALRLGVTAAADTDTDTAIALYAAGMLYRGKQVEYNKTDPTVVVPTMESLMTEEIKALLTKDDQPTYAADLFVFSPFDRSRSGDWTNSRS